MLSSIPSWAVAVAGAAIAIVATVTSTVLLHQSRASIAGERSEIAETYREVDRLWSSHRQADQRSTAADVFFAQAIGEESSRELLLQLAAQQLRGAVLSMWVASGEPVPERTPAEIAELEARLGKGDVGGYAPLKAKIDELRLLSQSHLNEKSARIRAGEARIEALEARESAIYLAYVFFNLLGLMVAMCKDLPVWRTQRPAGTPIEAERGAL